MKTTVYNFNGEEVGKIELSDDVFGVSSNNDLLHQVYVSISANRRKVVAHTKDRSEVAGSGKKPWKQKGTGRARTGSVKNPIWRKGGTIFGPTKERNFKKKINRKVKKKAIRIALSEKIRSGELVVVDKIELKEMKTKEVASGLKKLKLIGSVLFGLNKDEKDVYLCARNIENVDCVPADILNVFDILNHKKLILSEKTVKYLEKKYRPAEK
ncbi:MAG TPA: 50S ribosomal protein L4 [Candidatus Moranbacteria bacterium]|nr:50S ribosomal protein L4 [Candidatus Moranbacteria bacterium]